MKGMTRYFGKYRGKVTNNIDIQGQRGRIQAKVSDVLGYHESNWAEPCVPYAGNNVGFFFIPPVNAMVWIEFEQGDPDHPIWTGCFWDKTDKVPASPAIAETKVLKTDKVTITLDDLKDIVIIEMSGGMKIMMNNMEGKIEITNGKTASVELSANKVSINGTALEVE